MAAKSVKKGTAGKVVFAYRFDPGTPVALHEVEPTSLRVEDGLHEIVGRKKVPDSGVVTFSGAREYGYYIATGLVDGHPTQLRARGVDAEGARVLEQAAPPVGWSPVKFGTQGASEPARIDPPGIVAEDVKPGLVEKLAADHEAETLAQAARLAASRQQPA